MPHPELSVIIPAFNEEKTIASTCKRLNDFLSAHYASFEILFVNDGSMDQTAEMIGSLAKEYPAVRPEGYEKNRGKGCAVRTGMLAASGEVRVFTDCDLAYGESAIKDLVDAMKKSGADIVIGSRAIASDGYSGYSFLRKAMSRVYLCLIRLLTGFRHSDSQTGLKAYRGEAAEKIFSLCEVDSFAFDLESLLVAEKLGMKIAEIPCRILENRERESRINPFRDALKMLGDIRKMKKRIDRLDLADRNIKG